MRQHWKRRIFDIIQIGQDSDLISRSFDIVVMLLIVTNLFIAILDTFDSMAPLHTLLDRVELATVLCFTVEYVLRVWTAEYLYPENGRGMASLRYILSFAGLVDLLSFAPYYLPVFFPSGVVAFRMFRVIRILRLFRINAYYDALSVIGDVIRSKRDQLVSSIFIILVLMTAASLCMYSLEHESQPEVFRNAFSGFWWAVSTLLTVGYGDIYPVTAAGRLFGILITFLGVGMVAIPTGILSAGFVEQYTRIQARLDGTEEASLRFVRLTLQEGHPWAGRSIWELPLPSGLVPAAVRRQERMLLCRDKLTLQAGDQLILAARGQEDDRGITLKELTLPAAHPWVGSPVGELDLSRQTLVVLLKRGDELTVPEPDQVLAAGDTVVLYSARRMPDAVSVQI